MDHYKVLQVSRGAESEVIDRAYRALSLKYHPDVVPDTARDIATERMQMINAAYAVLGDPAKRRAYDRGLPADSDTSAWDVFMAKGILGMLFDKVAPRA